MGAGLIWSSIATKLTAQDPPTSKNWIINSIQVEDLDSIQDISQKDSRLDLSNPQTSLYNLQLSQRVKEMTSYMT